MASVGDWGELIDEAEAERFVGREQELETFRLQINLPKPRYLVFYITGQGGAGKSTLLNRYQDIAEEFGFLIADSDEQQRDVPAVLSRFAQQFEEQGFPLKHFNERYKTYRQKMHEIENDPEAPQGLAAILARTVVRVAYIGSDAIPIARKGLEFIPREAIEMQASEWATYLSKKLTNKEEFALVREPVPILTPLFFEELNKLTQTRKVLLCFDNFEAARPELREWLLQLKEYRPSQNIRIIIAGRDQPGAKWDPLRGVTQIIRIDVFTQQDAEAFLDTYSVTNTKRRKEILELSGRLPVLMSWLAVVEGNEFETSIPTHDIVERFLRWVTEPELKQVAMLASIPHSFNAEILKLLLEKRNKIFDEQAAFDWLQTMPFVYQSSEGWQYHDIVRRMMLHYQHQKSPQAYRQMHAILANFYDAERHELSSSEEEQWASEEWRKYTRAYIYHFLVADPNKHWGEVVSLFVIAIRKRRTFAVEMIEMLNLDDVHDELSSEQNGLIQLFRQQLQAIKDGDLQNGFEMFDKLSSINDLYPQAKGYALAYRGECHWLNEKQEQAFDDFEEALHYIPKDAWTIGSRGQIHRLMRHYHEALIDLNEAFSLDEKDIWVIIERGETYRLMGHYQEALEDFDCAIAIDDKDVWAIARRGETYRLLGHYHEALADLNQAIEFDHKFSWAFTSRGETYRLLGRYHEALADFNHAIELDQDYNWAIAHRGETYRLLGRYHDALADFNHAIELDQDYNWAITHRDLIDRQVENYKETLTDFDSAIELNEMKAGFSHDVERSI